MDIEKKEVINSEQKTEESIKKRKEKIIRWLKKPHNLILTVILIFAFALRLYYYFLTKGQAIWWDGAEYMNMARAWAFGLEYKFIPVRAILFSLITALFFKISNTEFLPRMLIFLFSMASIIGMYFLGKEICNRKIGLITSFLMSVLYLHLFHTYRLLVDLPSLTFFIFSAFFFYKYFKTNSKKSLYLGAAIIAIGTLFKISTAALLFVILIYLLITKKLDFIKKKEMWIAAIIFLLILTPYLIWGYLQFNGFVITQAGAWNAPQGNRFLNGFDNLKTYFSMFPFIFSWPLLLFFILGLFSMYNLFLGFDMLIKGDNIKLKRDLFLFLIFLIPIIIVSFSLGNVPEDRYIFVSFPAIFIIAGAFISKTYNFIKQKKKFLAILFLIVILGSIAYFQLQHADSLIKNKKPSYMEVKEAGLWLKENSEPFDIILSRSSHQIKFYSEREVFDIPQKEEDFEALLSSNPNIKLYMVSFFENHQEWMLLYPEQKNLSAVQAYFAGGDPEQPILIIYRLY